MNHRPRGPAPDLARPLPGPDADAAGVRAFDDRTLAARIGLLAAGAAVYVYLLILFGAMVRITGSGMGCGDDWPRCNGEWLPAWDMTTWIEWGHRLLGAGALVPLGMVLGSVWLHRNRPRIRELLVRPAAWILPLLLVQAILGATTVKLHLSAPVTAAHFVTACLLLALCLVLAVRGLTAPPLGPLPRVRALPLAAAVLALATVGIGALTANAGASTACVGFPLCNGSVVPALDGHGADLIWMHWIHRLLAYALVGLVTGAFVAFARERRRTGVPPSAWWAAVACVVLLAAQVAVGAGLVTLRLPVSLRNLHVALGVALCAALYLWALLAGPARAGRPDGEEYAAPSPGVGGAVARA